MLRSLRNGVRVMGLAWILARHDVLFFWRGDATFEKGQKLARALHAMGPTFIKLGQALSTRPDLVGQNIALALTQLQDRLPPFDGGIACAIVARELGKPVEQLFTHFEPHATAAGSIAQVHFATLANGREVAVKILRPQIEKAFARDLDLVYWLAGQVENWRPDWRRFKPFEVARMFEEMIRFELDLRFEAAAAVELRKNMQYDLGFYVPRIEWDYTARRVLTLERIYGIPIGQVEEIKAAGHSPARLVDIAAVSLFNQVFRDGFFHADMHPGNLFVRADGSIAVVDFGIMGRLDKKTRLYLARILHGFLTEDYVALARVHFEAGLVPSHKSEDNFALALMAITKPIIGRKLSEISVARLLGQLFTTAETFEIEVQPHLLLLQKNMMITEGIGRMLNPEVNMWEVAEPLVEEWAKENYGLAARVKEDAGDAVALLRRLPSILREAEDAIQRINHGGLKLHVDTVVALHLDKRRFHRMWLRFAWVSLLVFVLAYSTR